MKNIASQVLATVIAAGILANVTIWYQFGQRLTRIETKIENLTGAQLAKK